MAVMDMAATTLVMLPGMDGTAALYQESLGLDWGGMNACAIPLPQHGPQDYESLTAAIIPALPAGKLVLLAESFSTPLAMQIAASVGSRVKALVLVAGFCSSPQPGGLGWLPLRPIFSLKPPVMMLRQFLTGDAAPQRLLEELAAAIGRVPAAILAERARVVLALCEEDCPPLVGLPVLLLQARHDRVIPWDAQSQLERHFPDAACHWLDGPHLLMQTHAAGCRDAVLAFLKCSGLIASASS